MRFSRRLTYFTGSFPSAEIAGYAAKLAVESILKRPLWSLFPLSAGKVLPMLFPFEITRILAFFFAVYLTFYTATVLFSTSHKEKTVMGLFAIGATICFWITAFGTLNWD